MLRSTQIRQLALQLLFLFDAHGAIDEAMAAQAAADGSDDPETRRRAIEAARAAWENRQISDEWVERLAPQWPPRRQPGVDRNILRLAVWELTHTDTPPKVVIDEAIELAKTFSTENSPAFVNGVLDAVLKEVQTLKSNHQDTKAPRAGEE
jgi:transcription antitermination protein NusB